MRKSAGSFVALCRRSILLRGLTRFELQNTQKTKNCVFNTMAIVFGIFLFNMSSVAQTYVAVTNTSGTVAYPGGTSVTTTSAGPVTYGVTCTPAPHFQLISAGGSFTYTFSPPVSSV